MDDLATPLTGDQIPIGELLGPRVRDAEVKRAFRRSGAGFRLGQGAHGAAVAGIEIGPGIVAPRGGQTRQHVESRHIGLLAGQGLLHQLQAVVHVEFHRPRHRLMKTDASADWYLIGKDLFKILGDLLMPLLFRKRSRL